VAGDAASPLGWTFVPAAVAEDLHDVACVQGRVFAVGNQGVILHRDPAGVPWPYFLPQTADTSADLYTITFAVSPDGLSTYGATAGKDFQIWETKNLGVTWGIAPQCHAFIFDAFYGLHLYSLTQGFAAGVAANSAGAGFKYFGGASWVCGPTTYPGEIFYDVVRLGSSGWMVGDTGGKIYRTEDDGVTWVAVPAGTGKVVRAVAFSGLGHGVAVGGQGAIVRTQDPKGETWSPVTSPTSADLFGVAFWGSQSGWAVGAWGTILHTADGGRSWIVQPSGTTARLEGVCFTSPTEGFAVGAGGMILRTVTGGT
jgi:photosystem II stability/assembly factor-like uncharacterized protein